eukprot:gene20971-biopygen17620
MWHWRVCIDRRAGTSGRLCTRAPATPQWIPAPVTSRASGRCPVAWLIITGAGAPVWPGARAFAASLRSHCPVARLVA